MTDEERRAYYRAWYLKNAERVKARSRKWAEDNRDRQRENYRRWAAENPARVNAARRRWEEANPGKNREHLRAKQARRRARKKAAAGFATGSARMMRWQFYGGRCAYCPSDAVEMDHVIPLALGGSNWPANLRPVCKPCNTKKRDKPLAEFLSQRS